MAGIDVSIAGVIALYDACTGFPVRSSSIQLLTDCNKEPLYKGNGIYVLINDGKTRVKVAARVKGYHPFEEEFILNKNDGQIPKKIIWLVPDNTYKGYLVHTHFKIKTIKNSKFIVAIKCKEEQLRLSKERFQENDKLSLFQQKSINYEGLNVLITYKSDKEFTRKLISLIDEDTCKYQLDEALLEEVVNEKISLYKGYEISSDNDGIIEFLVPYIVEEAAELVLYTIDGEKVTPIDISRLVYK